MKVLHVAESAKGGVGAYLGYSLPHQISLIGRSNVRLVAPVQHREQIGPLPEETVAGFDRPARTVASLRTMAEAVAAQVHALKPDVIHAHSTLAGMVVRGMYGWRRHRPAIVYCPHGWAFDVGADAWKRAAVARAERIMAGACDAIVAISRFEAEEAHRVGIAPGKVHLVVSGIPDAPATAPAPWSDTRRKVLFVGRLDRQKGVDVLLSAVAPLVDTVCVRVAGVSVTDGVAIEQPSNVDMLGWLNPSAIVAQLQAADVVVVPSRWEGFGLVAAEAMRAGKPVIASNVGGLRELVVDGVTGRLVSPGSAGALGAALMREDAAALARMGAQGRRRYLERFTAMRMNSSLLGLYVQLASRRQGADVRLEPAVAPAAVVQGR